MASWERRTQIVRFAFQERENIQEEEAYEQTKGYTAS